MHLDRFITRARERVEYDLPADDQSACARVRLDGRTLSGFTFGARGQGMFCRIYDKTRQSPAEAPIRGLWDHAGYDAERDGVVWRVEFEFRRSLLRELRDDAQWMPDAPSELLAGRLNELWRYAATHWLRLHAAHPSRGKRPEVEPWWEALGLLDFGAGTLDANPPLRREAPPAADTHRLMASLTGSFTSIAAAWRITDIDRACDALAAHLRSHPGQAGFRSAVIKRKERWPVPAVPPTPAPPVLAAAVCTCATTEDKRPSAARRLQRRLRTLVRRRWRYA